MGLDEAGNSEAVKPPRTARGEAYATIHGFDNLPRHANLNARRPAQRVALVVHRATASFPSAQPSSRYQTLFVNWALVLRSPVRVASWNGAVRNGAPASVTI
jgi:hypothetical protein